MDGATVAAWVGVGLLALSSIGTSVFTIVRTNRERNRANGRIEEKLKNLKEASDKCSEGIEKVSKDITEMKTHCAATTSTFSAQIANLQKEINSRG